MKPMNRFFLLLVGGLLGWQTYPVLAADATKLPFDSYSGYFVSNQFEPKAPESFLVVNDQQQFDKVFGVGMVMNDRSHRLAKDAFKSNIVVAAIKRGDEVWDYKVESVTVENGVVSLRYTAKSTKNESATFACPLIVSIPKDQYKTIQFIENQKTVKALEIKTPETGKK